MATTLKVRPVGSAMVPNYEARGVRRFIGRSYDETSKSWVASDEPVEVPNTVEYRLAIADGDLAEVAS